MKKRSKETMKQYEKGPVDRKLDKKELAMVNKGKMPKVVEGKKK